MSYDTKKVMIKIDEPSYELKNIDESYRKQNEFLWKTRMLYTSFDGMKFGNWETNNTELPYILKGSICEFGGSLFEAKEDIILEDDFDYTNGEFETYDLRYIKLVISEDGKTLTPVIKAYSSDLSDDQVPKYDTDGRGFYYYDVIGDWNEDKGQWENIRKVFKEKYLRVYFHYVKRNETDTYYKKEYWEIDDIERIGKYVKRNVVTFNTPGEHEFEYPLMADEITIHMTGGGGEGADLIYSGEVWTTIKGGDGGDSVIKIITNDKEEKTIATAGGGKGGDYTLGGKGGKGSGDGEFWNGKNGSYINISSGGPGGKGGEQTLALGGSGGKGYGSGGGGGAGASAKVPLKVGMLGENKTVFITVGKGGDCKDARSRAEKGQDGQAVIEYYTRG